MPCTFPALLSDDELRAQLKLRDTVFFVGQEIDWLAVERQVERLGFGEQFIVCSAQASRSGTTTIRVEPLRAAAA